MGRFLPAYPVYVPSYGRSGSNLTARFLIKDRVPFRLVVQPQELALYTEALGDSVDYLVLPRSIKGLLATRNWIKDHSAEEGHVRHWQLDDNIESVKRLFRGKRIKCNSGNALRVCEEFSDRYTNVAVSGLQYSMFLPNGAAYPPFYRNSKVYSCSLINNAIPHRWRLRYNDDVDLCLQVLADGWCTVILNAFMIKKVRTMKVKGGNTPIYQGDGRLEMSRSLERCWPGVVDTKRRWGRPQHVVKDAWRKFDNALIRRDDIDWESLRKGGANEHGMQLVQVAPEVKSNDLRKLLQAQAIKPPGATVSRPTATDLGS